MMTQTLQFYYNSSVQQLRMEFALTSCFLVLSTLSALPGLIAHSNKLTRLEDRLLDLVVECKSCKGKPGSHLGKDRPAFTVTLKKHQTLSKNDEILKFDTEILNQGGGYNLKTGIFTAPKSGLYQISVTVVVTGTKTLRLELVKNDTILMLLYGPSINGASQTANPVLDLKKGDKVNVEIQSGHSPQYVNGDRYTYFSGYYIM